MMSMGGETIGVVQGWMTRPKGSLAVVIPRAAREMAGYQRGDRFIVKVDEEKRIIYEKIPGRQDPATNEDPASQTQPTPATEACR